MAELGPEAGSDVLAVGFGPGVGIAELTRHCSRGFVAGVDPSTGMLKRAKALNRQAIAEGWVDLRLRTAEMLPFQDQSFDGAWRSTACNRGIRCQPGSVKSGGCCGVVGPLWCSPTTGRSREGVPSQISSRWRVS